MLTLKPGMRENLDQFLAPDLPLTVEIKIIGFGVYTALCLGVDSEGQARRDGYLIFNRHPLSSRREIVYAERKVTKAFTVNLSALPEDVSRLIFAVNCDSGILAEKMESLLLRIGQNNKAVMEFSLEGKNFANNEKALVALELYKKNAWRLAAVGQGFCAGIAALLNYHGCAEFNKCFIDPGDRVGASTRKEAGKPASSQEKQGASKQAPHIPGKKAEPVLTQPSPEEIKKRSQELLEIAAGKRSETPVPRRARSAPQPSTVPGLLSREAPLSQRAEELIDIANGKNDAEGSFFSKLANTWNGWFKK